MPKFILWNVEVRRDLQLLILEVSMRMMQIFRYSLQTGGLSQIDRWGPSFSHCLTSRHTSWYPKSRIVDGLISNIGPNRRRGNFRLDCSIPKVSRMNLKSVSAESPPPFFPFRRKIGGIYPISPAARPPARPPARPAISRLPI